MPSPGLSDSVARRLFDLVCSLADSAVVAGSGRSSAINLLPSQIGTEPGQHKASRIILIDIGGSSTKVGVRQVGATNEVSWRILFELPNDKFDVGVSGDSSLSRFGRAVAERVVAELSESVKCDPLQAPWGLGIVWSCAQSNSIVGGSDGIPRSIRGVVADRENYSKGEWFNHDTKNGDPIADPFIEGFARSGLVISQYLVGNDTPLTMKAVADADAGMVASTGLNATMVDYSSGAPIVCNAEIGVSFVMPEWALAEGDMIGVGVRARTVEQVVAGKFLPQIFAGHILAHGRRPNGGLSKLAHHLEELGERAYEFFNTEDVGILTHTPEQLLTSHAEHRGLLEGCLAELSEIAVALVGRSAFLASLVAYGSIYSQLGKKNELRIAFDSRLAREIPLFNSTIRSALASLMPQGKSAELILVDRVAVPGGVLSVPMQGAANALDSL